jgi:hypothetical protein
MAGAYKENRIIATIRILDLNHNDFVEQRIDIIRSYVLGNVTFGQHQEKYPFVAYEILDKTLTIHLRTACMQCFQLIHRYKG